MSNYLTYNNIIDILTDIASRSKVINTFYLGKDYDFENDGDIQYPVLQVFPTLARLPRNAQGEYKTIQINLECKILDLSQQSNFNEKDVHSDMIQVAQDVINELNQHPYYQTSNVSLLTDIEISVLDEFEDDYAAGVGFNLALQLVNNNTFCGLPFDPISGVTYNGPSVTGYSYTATLNCDDLYGCQVIIDLGNDITDIYNILSGLTASTNTDVFVTGGTYSNGTTIFTNNTGGTFNVTGYYTGGTTPTDVFVTGGTYSNGTAIFTNNTGATFNVTGFYTGSTDVYVTGATYSAGTAIFTNNTGGTFSLSGLSTGTSSTDIYVTGGTYSNGTATYTNNTGGTFSVSGFLTGTTDVYTTGLTFNNATYDLTITRNDAVTLTANLGLLASDVKVTGGTYDINTGVVTFTNTTGGTFQVSGFTSGMTDTLVTGFTYDNANTLTIYNSNGINYPVTINTMTGLTINGSFSATTYLGLPTDVFVTGGTYTAGTATFTNNTGGTFNVTGFSTGGGNDYWSASTGASALVVSGGNSLASATLALAEGLQTLASGLYSHSEGNLTTAGGLTSHAEGTSTRASGDYSHAEGNLTLASNTYAHAEGWYSTASGIYSHAEGGLTIATGYGSHAEGQQTQAIAFQAHAEGDGSIASGVASHAEGYLSVASANYAHAEGQQCVANAVAAHAEGLQTLASGIASHAEGNNTTASGYRSHAEGEGTTASGNYAHTQGFYTIGSGFFSHAEGRQTTSAGEFSHAGGAYSQANGQNSFVHGQYSIAQANDTIVLGSNITGSTASSTYVDNFNIKTLGAGASVTTLGRDANGFIVSATTGGSDVFVTGGTYTAGTATFTNNTGGTFSVTGFSSGGTGSETAFTGDSVTGKIVTIAGTTPPVNNTTQDSITLYNAKVTSATTGCFAMGSPTYNQAYIGNYGSETGNINGSFAFGPSADNTDKGINSNLAIALSHLYWIKSGATHSGIFGGSGNTIGQNAIASVIIGGAGNSISNNVTGSTILGGNNKILNDSNTTLVDRLIIGTVPSNPIVANLGIDGNGLVVIGTTGSSSTDVFVTGGTYTAGTATFTNTTGGTFSVTGFSTGSTSTITSNGYIAVTGSTVLTLTGIPMDMSFAVSDETTQITTGTTKLTLYAPYNFVITDAMASLSLTGTSATTINIKNNGTSIFSTKITIDANQALSKLSATQPVITGNTITANNKITIDFDTVGSGCTGVKVYLLGTRTL